MLVINDAALFLNVNKKYLLAGPPLNGFLIGRQNCFIIMLFVRGGQVFYEIYI